MATNISTPSAVSEPAILGRTLQNLDRYLAAAEHGVDHPWRVEIASALRNAELCGTAPASQPLIIDYCYGSLRLPRLALIDQAEMRIRQLRGILFGMQAGTEADEMLALAYELAVDLAEDLVAKDYRLARPLQLSRLILLIQDDDGPDDMLWLCQQFADEVLAVTKALGEQKAAGVTA